MSTDLTELFDSNRAWQQARLADDPEYFKKLASQHAPGYLWIGCADARVPANEILGLPPGEVFVHRNIANLVVHSDFNAQSVIQFAVDVLKVEHVMVVGHYGCAGVQASLRGTRIGLADNWLYHLRDVQDRYADRLASIPYATVRHDRLCELNVLEQVVNVCQTNVVQYAWGRQQNLTVHGWVYGVGDGLLRNLGLTVSGKEGLAAAHQAAVEAVFAQPPGAVRPAG
ncbi:MAG: Carbonic anhydrase [Hydrocarboniphaga sp.]|uniref:carbonate dehydratase n=1 Tax=Hydrocarboniphaga sp. TaxID=2033016 RepID=UPI002631D019|nr:carbonate dehydratase [Hydrocarboniphaga sp.]MDB5968563.1 Carbonic anhydrase [Hydrocarboniphaga sp.]